ncbi:hypothetical protein F5879DRAFT_922121 [Lentinula edodes]|uniref:uncharacterized protein n=1 Tax=Lentinula edodes TaxID=5353 RepID=UPI001BFA722C|nr:uncharacterized protein C8R40DRAFT_1055915 [Lentinula edodes]KAF8827500.1 hypothetical protein HHX47_DHR4000055 [Lentinula edodes]KAH7870926.1 hypothetical protein C8R40DRAFT_1055915 [Lentinula edodes]KAJ3904591.1 hypothetical protein F5879DRAFT_922121 [Lentinula edodes]
MLTFIISCLFFSVVRALPTLLSRDVFDPPITSPSASTIWQVGQTVTVIWDITNLPPASQLTDPNGTVVLGYMASSTDSEHLMIDSPLAQDFPLSDGNVSFIVPSVVTRSDYIIALFGDSGNISPTFTIQGTESTSSAPTTSTFVSTLLSTSSSISVPTSSSPSTLQTTVVTEAEASSSASTFAPESSATNTVTSVITVSSGPASSTTAEIGSASSLSISSTSGSSASPSATEAAASSNSAWQPGVSQSQVYAFVVAGLLAACLL